MRTGWTGWGSSTTCGSSRCSRWHGDRRRAVRAHPPPVLRRALEDPDDLGPARRPPQHGLPGDRVRRGQRRAPGPAGAARRGHGSDRPDARAASPRRAAARSVRGGAMIDAAQRARIRRLFFAEHWKVGTIAAELGVHHDAVHHAIESDRFVSAGSLVRPSMLDPYKGLVGGILTDYP